MKRRQFVIVLALESHDFNSPMDAEKLIARLVGRMLVQEGFDLPYVQTCCELPELPDTITLGKPTTFLGPRS